MLGYRMAVSTADGSQQLGTLVYPLPDLVQQYSQRVSLSGLTNTSFIPTVSGYLKLYANNIWLCSNNSGYLTVYRELGIVNRYFLRYGEGSLMPGVSDNTVGIRFTFANGSYIIWDSANSALIDRLRYYDSNNTLLVTATGNNYNQYCPFILPLPLMFNGEIDAYGRGIWGGSKAGVSPGFSFGTVIIELTGSLYLWYHGLEPIDLDDPYSDIPDSGPSGPAEGSGIPETAGIDIPSLPTVSILDTGFINLFNPTLSQVQSLADYMWSAGFDLATFKKLFADPMDCILGFNLVPVNVPSGSAATIMVGNISTTVSMNVATSQWVELDCGSINIDKAYGSYLDFAPYSKFSLYLPYIGTVELSTDDVVGRTLKLVYHVDVLSCSCVAYLKCGPDTLYQFTGSCGYSVPLTGQNFREMVGAVIDLAVNLGGVLAGGNAVSGVGAIAKDVMNLKPTIHRSGAIGASAGIMGIQTAYVIMELPNACKPKKQYHYTGYPGFITVKIGDLTGYAEFEEVILDGIGCTSEERNMIDGLLKGGVYV